MAHVHHLALLTPADDLTPDSNSTSHNDATTRMKLTMTRRSSSGSSAAGQSSGLFPKSFWLDEVWARNQRPANDRRGSKHYGEKNLPRTIRRCLLETSRRPAALRRQDILERKSYDGALSTWRLLDKDMHPCTSRGVSRQRRESFQSSHKEKRFAPVMI